MLSKQRIQIFVNGKQSAYSGVQWEGALKLSQTKRNQQQQQQQ